MFQTIHHERNGIVRTKACQVNLSFHRWTRRRTNPPKSQNIDFNCAFPKIPKFLMKVKSDVSSLSNSTPNTLICNRRSNWTQLGSKVAEDSQLRLTTQVNSLLVIPIFLAVGP